MACFVAYVSSGEVVQLGHELHGLSVVLDLLAKLNYFLQGKATDFSHLPIVLKSILSEVKHLKDNGAEWCSLVEKTAALLESEHNITLAMGGTQSCTAGASTLTRYCKEVVCPRIDILVSDITSRFSDQAVKLLVSLSIFNPVSFPAETAALPELVNKELQVLVDFYGKEETAEFGGTTVSSPPLWMVKRSWQSGEYSSELLPWS